MDKDELKQELEDLLTDLESDFTQASYYSSLAQEHLNTCEYVLIHIRNLVGQVGELDDE